MSHIKDATRHWQLAQGNGNGLEGDTERVHRKQESWGSAVWLGRVPIVPREWNTGTDRFLRDVFLSR